MRKTLVVVENPENDALTVALEEIFLHPMMKEKGFDVHDLEKDYLVTKEIDEVVNKYQREDVNKINALREKMLFLIAMNCMRGNYAIIY